MDTLLLHCGTVWLVTDGLAVDPGAGGVEPVRMVFRVVQPDLGKVAVFDGQGQCLKDAVKFRRRFIGQATRQAGFDIVETEHSF